MPLVFLLPEKSITLNRIKLVNTEFEKLMGKYKNNAVKNATIWKEIVQIGLLYFHGMYA